MQFQEGNSHEAAPTDADVLCSQSVGSQGLPFLIAPWLGSNHSGCGSTSLNTLGMTVHDPINPIRTSQLGQAGTSLAPSAQTRGK